MTARFDPASPLDPDGFLTQPVVVRAGRGSVLRRSRSGSGPHRFGGALPAHAELPGGVILHTVFDLDVHRCEVLADLRLARLPLVFPFRHDDGRIAYRWSQQRLELEELKGGNAQSDWPYEGFPMALPESTWTSTPASDVDPATLEAWLHQGLGELPTDAAVVVVPARGDYGVSLWGESGDAEGVQCVFVIDASTGRVTARNQCS